MRRLAITTALIAGASCDRLLQLGPVSTRDAGSNSGGDGGSGVIAWVNGNALADTKHLSIVTMELKPPPIVGDMLVFAAVTYEGSLTLVTDTASNQYTKWASSPISSDVNQLWLALAPVTTTAAEPFLITATTNANEVTVSVDEYSGLAEVSSPHDGTGTPGRNVQPSCGQLVVDAPALVYAAMTHDDGGAAGSGAGFMFRHDATADITNSTTLTVEDAVKLSSGPEVPTFMIQSGASPTGSWACAQLVLR